MRWDRSWLAEMPLVSCAFLGGCHVNQGEGNDRFGGRGSRTAPRNQVWQFVLAAGFPFEVH